MSDESDLAFARRLERETSEQFHKAKADNGKPKPKPAPKERKAKLKSDELGIRRHIHGSEVNNIVRFDTFTGKPILQAHVPRPGLPVPKTFEPRPWQDTDTTAFIEWLLGEKFDKVRRSTVDHVIMLEAASKSYSGARERFESIPSWDGTKRLDTFLIEVCGLRSDDAERMEYWRRVSRRFFISIVARVFKPGCKVDTVMVLEGPQGIKKSQLLRVFALCDEWFSDSLPHNLGSKDAKQHLLGKLIVEMSEIAQMDKTSSEVVKAFLSAQDDKFRPPYGRHEVQWDRQCVFVGTTNDDTYLRDITGNRRFWPVECGEIDLDLARRGINQVYAEAMAAYWEGERWWFENGENEQAQEEQAGRQIRDPWESIARDKLRALEIDAVNREAISFDVEPVATLLEWFSITIEKQDGMQLSRVGKILKSLGGFQVRKAGNDRKRVRRFHIGNIGRDI